MLTTEQRRRRIEFANYHLNKPQREWDTWIWSDEKVITFSIDCPAGLPNSFMHQSKYSEDGRLRIWRPKKDTQLDPRYVVMDSGITCNFWGCMNAAGWFANRPDIFKLDWCAKPPDLNPLENVWTIMIRE
ncbi:hypothetical protein ALC57_02250 [Trachymyrmex cornetzi]|uniref:Transposable element Tc1 transposase n=1 Tax=Trachymyrmex cornetzi TaxID=471704 RepID=A0A151JNX7_9HYME|nr:hypothetical protein ALC57_02250 [Trachymyrmex cornetzi]